MWRAEARASRAARASMEQSLAACAAVEEFAAQCLSSIISNSSAEIPGRLSVTTSVGLVPKKQCRGQIPRKTFSHFLSDSGAGTRVSRVLPSLQEREHVCAAMGKIGQAMHCAERTSDYK